MLLLSIPALVLLLPTPTTAAAAGPHPSLVSSSYRQSPQHKQSSSFWGVRGGQHEEQQPLPQPPSMDENAHDATPPPPPIPTEAPLPAPGPPQPPSLPVVHEEITSDNDENSINNKVILPLTFTEDERDVLDALSTARTWEKLLHACGKIEGIRNCPDFHMKITHASRGDAVLASMALVRLARLVSTAGEEGGSEGGAGGAAAVEEVRARVTSDRRVEQLLECAACHIDNLSVHDISNLFYAFSILQIQELDFLSRLFTAATIALQHNRWPSLQPSELVTLTWSLAHLQGHPPSIPPSPPLLAVLETRLLLLVPALTPHDLSRLSWALSILLQNHPSLPPALPLLYKMAEVTLAHHHNFSIKELVMVASSLAGLGVGGGREGGMKGWREGVAKACGGRLAELEVGDLAAVARTFAMWGEGGREGGGEGGREVLMLELLVCAEAKKVDLLREGGREGGRGVVDVVYCFAMNKFWNATGFMMRELPEIFAAATTGAAATAAGSGVEEWLARDLTKLLWAYVFLMEGSGGGAGGAGEQQHQQQQHLLSALAGRTCVRVLETISSPSTSSSSSTPPSLLVQLAWSLATLGHYDPDLFTALSHSLLPAHLPSLSLSEIACLSWSFASVGHHVKSLFLDRVVMVLEQQHAHFSLRDLGMCLWAVALTGYECLGVFTGGRREEGKVEGREEGEGGWVKEKEGELREMRPSEEVKLFWALAKLLPPNNNYVLEGGKEGGTFTLREEVLNAICQDLRTKLATFSPQDLVMTAWGLPRLYGPLGSSSFFSSSASLPSRKLLSHLCKQLPAWLPSFTVPELGSLLQSLSTLHQPVDPLWDLFKEEVERRLKLLLDAEEGAAGGGGGGGRGGKEGGVEDGFFHLARCQALLGLWKRRGGMC